MLQELHAKDRKAAACILGVMIVERSLAFREERRDRMNDPLYPVVHVIDMTFATLGRMGQQRQMNL